MKRSMVCAILCLGLMLPALCDAKPAKDKPRKGLPADQPVVVAPYDFSSTLSTKVDGNLKDWYNLESVGFQTLISGEYDYDWTGPRDLSAQLKTQYSEKAIHMLVQVKDNVVVDKLRQWKSDRVEVWLLAEDKAGKPLGKLTGVQFDLGPVTKNMPLGIKVLAGNKDLSKIKAVPFIQQEDDEHMAYDIEFSVDYALFSKVSPVYDGALRYCVIVRDWDEDDANEDEAAISNCPINPAKPATVKPDDMAKIKLDLERVMWQSLIGADDAIAAKSGDWIFGNANVASTSEPESIAYNDNQFVIYGFDIYENAGFSWNTMALNGSSTDPKMSFADVDGDKLDEIFITRTETCLEPGLTAQRVYVFDFSNTQGLRLGTNYLASVTDTNTGKTYANKFQNTKSGIVQTPGTGDFIECTLDYSDDMEPILPKGAKKHTIKF